MLKNITVEDLIRAYKNAKIDCFYESGHNSALDFAQYEVNLSHNILNLHAKITSGVTDWLYDRNFLGTYVLMLKDSEVKPSDSEVKDFTFYSNKIKNLKDIKGISSKFRVLGLLSVNFHILSSLWIEKVGYKLERNITHHSYGCRLKQHSNLRITFSDEENQKTTFNNGHFRPYYKDYQLWQQNGINAIEDALKREKQVIAITADIKQFYHRIRPNFLLHESFLTSLDQFDLHEDERELTSLLITAINNWSRGVPENYRIEHYFEDMLDYGIPITLSASKVIANLILLHLDNDILQEIMPLYYGRYVDDIFLVIEDRGKISSRNDFWTFVSKRLESLSFDKNSNSGAIYSTEYTTDCRIEFGLGKEKLFILEGSSGQSFINSLKDNLKENSSEWKLLPDGEEELDELAQEMTKTISNNNDIINGIRKADGISIQRLKFALHLRNFETLVNLLPKELWRHGLHRFFSLINDFIISPEKIHTYLRYYPRLIKLAISADEPHLANNTWIEILRSWKLLINEHNPREKIACIRAKNFSIRLLVEAVYCSIPPNFIWNNKDTEWVKLVELTKKNWKEIELYKDLLFRADLHRIPFKRIFFKEFEHFFGDSILKNFKKHILTIDDEIGKRCSEFNGVTSFINKTTVHKKSKSIPKALVFYTRRFTTLELTELLPNWSNSEFRLKQLNEILQAFHREKIRVNISLIHEDDLSNTRTIDLKISKKSSKKKNPTFVLTSFQTEDKSWTSWVRDDNVEPDPKRYTRLFRMINNIITCGEEIDYVVFPEVSIPRNIVKFISRKLGASGISIIAGVEYLKKTETPDLFEGVKGTVSNQLLYILNLKGITNNQQVIITQEKTIPAIHEESELYSVGGKLLVASSNCKYVISHGKFIFSGLICNDLLNIDYRQILRGKIDALIAVEWNKDVDMYNSIVQSTSNDLHCFVIQVNNRLYGDTRLRGPYKESHQRDMVRVRGGELDYFVVSTVDIVSLREFQRFHRSPSKPFKPVPTGFLMSTSRRNNL